MRKSLETASKYIFGALNYGLIYFLYAECHSYLLPEVFFFVYRLWGGTVGIEFKKKKSKMLTCHIKICKYVTVC